MRVLADHTTRMYARSAVDEGRAGYAAFCHDCGWETEGLDRDTVESAAMRHEYTTQTVRDDSGSASLTTVALVALFALPVVMVVWFAALLAGSVAGTVA